MIFAGLSILGTEGPLQLLRNAAGALASGCLLCAGRSVPGAACAACVAGLARSAWACPRCALPMPRAETCGRCLRKPPPLDAALAAFDYRFPVDRVLLGFKNGGDLAAGRWLASGLAEAVGTARLPDLVVVPPADPARLRERGFHPALEVAKVVAGARGATVDRAALVRLRATPAQSTLGARERRANLRGAFGCRRDLRGLHVAIVDDVMTTGATVEAAARALRGAGAARVEAWVVARTPEPAD